ncbi:MAG TPA: hypothetical protein PKD32_11065 [Saprospiraceae bacterium]|nr:hypothetical protein [Saprospiraceae bacterium]
MKNMNKLIMFIATLFLLSCSTKKVVISKIPILIDKDAKAAGFNVFYIPIKLEGVEKEFKMQFDLGLDLSAIYGNSLKAIYEKYPKLKQNYFERDDYQILKTKYFISEIESSLDSLFVFSDYGSDKKYEEQNIIGSIGVNQFKNQILLINYSEYFVQIFNDYSQIDKAKFDFTPMTVTKNNKIIIKLKAGNSLVDFLFDTGNGVPIATINKTFFDEQTENQKELRDTISGNSWGETISLYGAKQQKKISVGNTNFTIGENRIYYTEAKRILELYEDLGVEHSIGNNFFMDKTILFDFTKNQFAIMK